AESRKRRRPLRPAVGESVTRGEAPACSGGITTPGSGGVPLRSRHHNFVRFRQKWRHGAMAPAFWNDASLEQRERAARLSRKSNQPGSRRTHSSEGVLLPAAADRQRASIRRGTSSL